MDLETSVARLNRLFKLYAKASGNDRIKAYRISQIRNYLEDLLLEVSKEHQILELDLENIPENFPELQAKLNPLIERKKEAVVLNNFEQAAMLKYQEKLVIKNFLIKMGIPSNVYFFQYHNQIFKV